VITTLSTVGYGDLVPYSGWGKLLGSITIILSTLCLTIPIASIHSRFVEAHSANIDAQRKHRRALRIGRQASLIMMKSKRRLPLRRAWNKWKEFVECERAKESHVAVEQQTKEIAQAEQFDEGESFEAEYDEGIFADSVALPEPIDPSGMIVGDGDNCATIEELMQMIAAQSAYVDNLSSQMNQLITASVRQEIQNQLE
jgi:hypothetical protein